MTCAQCDLDETTFVERPMPNQLIHAIKIQLVSEMMSRKIVSRHRKFIDTRDASAAFTGNKYLPEALTLTSVSLQFRTKTAPKISKAF